MRADRFRPAAVLALSVMLSCLPDAVQARDRGINQPGAVGNVGVGTPGLGARDPGINQPGAMGNVGAGTRGRGPGAPGVVLAVPGLNQPGIAGNIGGVARRTVRR